MSQKVDHRLYPEDLEGLSEIAFVGAKTVWLNADRKQPKYVANLAKLAKVAYEQGIKVSGNFVPEEIKGMPAADKSVDDEVEEFISTREARAKAWAARFTWKELQQFCRKHDVRAYGKKIEMGQRLADFGLTPPDVKLM